ncbi:MAG: hypothetical protein JST92_21605 [Deltaproteobacteria bacterium]|nr:hypothetical protein [Deltaproteobacteria bacterium]
MQRDANQQICRLGGNAEAQFEAHATLFSDEFSILDAKGTVSANDNDDLKAWVDSKLYVVGYQVFDTNGHYNLTGSPYTKNWGDGDKIQVIEVPFQVAWVTITVSAGIEYDYGVNVVLNAGTVTSKSCVPSNPVLSATATFTPYADLGGWVDADASLLGGLVGVGVEIQLTLVGLQLPLSARLAVEPKNINNVPYLGITFNAGLNLILTTLKGELDFYLKAFWVKVFSMKVFGWDGFSHTFPVFRTPEVNIPLVQLGGGTIQPTSDSDARTSEL